MDKPPIEQVMKDRMMSNAFYKNSTLAEALAPEQARQKKLKEIRVKYGMPEPPQKRPQGNPRQWEGDNKS